ncbi:hypothetical protein KUG88_18145 [Rhodococcus rhodochrous]|uniref:hypothetical protein n=1 Tax=Rhodococcus rhodochrous TaxID=1829 RepID=UPI001E45670C|nr:hypothetical protein [Rhodococcus rhodochrous]MCB8912052.1 hypothetical protein [Rhodococcus rhodochrous]
MTNSSENLSLSAAADEKGLVLAWSNGNGTRETEYHVWKRHREPGEETFLVSFVDEDEASRCIEAYDPQK